MREPTSACKIPGVRRLKRMLKYDDPYSESCKALVGDLKGFSLNFTTSFGARGSHLVNWRSAEHKTGLREMTEAWLEQCKGGPDFWPSDSQHRNYNGLQYTKHREFIKSHVMQLFFKMNNHCNQYQRARRAAHNPARVGRKSHKHHHSIQNNQEKGVGGSASEHGAEDDEELPTLADLYDAPMSPESDTHEKGKRKVVTLPSTEEHLQARINEESETTQERPAKHRKHNAETANSALTRQKKTKSRIKAAKTRRQPPRTRRVPINYKYQLGIPDSDVSDAGDELQEQPRMQSRNPQHAAASLAREDSMPTIDEDSQQTLEAPQASSRGPLLPDAALHTDRATESPVSALTSIREASIAAEGSKSPHATFKKPDPVRPSSPTPTERMSMVPITGAIANIIDVDGVVLGTLGKIQLNNQWTEHIMSLPVQRPVVIRRGRKFTEETLSSIYDESDLKGVRWLSCMIQATGTVQQQRCVACDKNQGAFAKCVVVGGPLFEKCGNCEWNRHGCHGLAGGQTHSGSQEPSQGSSGAWRLTETFDEDRSVSQMEPATMRPPVIAPLYTQSPSRSGDPFVTEVTGRQSGASTEALVGSENPRRSYTVEADLGFRTQHMPSTSRGSPRLSARSESISLGGDDDPDTRNLGAPQVPLVDILYNVVKKRLPEPDEVSWKPQGPFRDKSLAEFTKEIPLKLSPDAKGFWFTFTRKATGLRLRRGIDRGQDGAFDMWKDRVSEAIEDIQLKEAGHTRCLTFLMNIEEMKEGTDTAEEGQSGKFLSW